jgi:hypothetical protein
VPLRETIAQAMIVPELARRSGAHIVVATTDRGSIELRADLVKVRSYAGFAFALTPNNALACTPIMPEAGALGTGFVPCDTQLSIAGAWPASAERMGMPAAPSPAATMPRGAAAHSVFTAGRFDASAYASGTAGLLALREPAARLHLFREDYTHVVDSAGAQVATADLDQDAQPEVVYSQDAGEDALVIATVTRSGVRVRARLAAAGGVRAIAVCPPEASGKPAIVAAVGSEVWLVR